MDNYVLDGKEVKVESDLLKWAEWFGKAERCVAQDFLNSGNIHVSTVFLGIDHAFGGGEPLLFEPMVFGGPLDQEQVRYTSWAEAVDGHARMLARCKQGG